MTVDTCSQKHKHLDMDRQKTNVPTRTDIYIYTYITEIYMHKHTNTYIYIYVYVYIHTCISVDPLKENVCVYICTNNKSVCTNTNLHAPIKPLSSLCCHISTNINICVTSTAPNMAADMQNHKKQ